MGSKIDLLFVDDCPNIESARKNLRLALKQLGWLEEWREINLSGADSPPSLRGFPSPTIMMNGRDILSGKKTASGIGACRTAGAPGSDLIFSKLKMGTSKGWLGFAGAAPAALIGLFPALFCPACYPALAGLLASIGLGAFASDAILKPLTLLFLGIALAGFIFQSTRTKNYWPLRVGILGAVGFYAGLYWFFSVPLRYVGIALLMGASIWDFLQGKRIAKKDTCPACEIKGGDSHGKKES